jgi:hypothetical protein
MYKDVLFTGISQRKSPDSKTCEINYFQEEVKYVQLDPVEGTVSLSLCIYIYVYIIYY